jgi:hypothetical protein
VRRLSFRSRGLGVTHAEWNITDSGLSFPQGTQSVAGWPIRDSPTVTGGSLPLVVPQPSGGLPHRARTTDLS